jgi:hypothetical protein
MFYPGKLILLLVTCGSTIAGAQTARGANPTPATATSSHPVKRGSAASPARHKPVPVDQEYWLFIADKARDHESIQREIQSHPDRFPPDIELRDMSMHIGIRPEEYATVLTHILDANDRLQKNETQWRAALARFQNSVDYSAKSIPPPELIALGKEHDAIINGTIHSLKQELGSQSFHKLDTWVDLYFRSETSTPATGTEPSEPRLFADPSTLQAPAVEA